MKTRQFYPHDYLHRRSGLSVLPALAHAATSGKRRGSRDETEFERTMPTCWLLERR
ncbi:hypothetical protein M408DRAFT_327133 [Serendipita vermifera MAFF 305830]|uniref:Uncharacterized protein n=1 Tax=Serendipita vermifera MAFF 305830 TaxID=933852 RepID=A0A0C2X048_SERVB|nr:hypothetical protein M408DRAFT_327133 [Serendipita vermifera MAFF 305830]